MSPCDDLLNLAKNSDILIHDATFDSSLENKANTYGHSTAQQAATIAAKAKVGMLFLTHISPRYKDGEILVEEARKIFSKSYVAHDFMEIEVKMKK